MIGTVHLLQSRTDEAIIWFEKARSVTPDVPNITGASRRRLCPQRRDRTRYRRTRGSPQIGRRSFFQHRRSEGRCIFWGAEDPPLVRSHLSRRPAQGGNAGGVKRTGVAAEDGHSCVVSSRIRWPKKLPQQGAGNAEALSFRGAGFAREPEIHEHEPIKAVVRPVFLASGPGPEGPSRNDGRRRRCEGGRATQGSSWTRVLVLAMLKLPQLHRSIAGIGCPRAGTKLSFEELGIPDLDLIKQAEQGAFPAPSRPF